MKLATFNPDSNRSILRSKKRDADISQLSFGKMNGEHYFHMSFLEQTGEKTYVRHQFIMSPAEARQLHNALAQFVLSEHNISDNHSTLVL